MKVVVVGVGQLGQHHARVLSQSKDVSLAAIVDLNEAVARTVSKKLGEIPYYTSTASLPIQPNAAIIATPTPTHYQITKEFLLKGVHCFVEKPITQTTEEAQELIEIAESKNLILQVGHIERFNPAVVAAKPYVKDPKFVEAYRIGPFSSRVSHIGVVMDLMIHDIDILLYLINSPIKDIEAYGARILTEHEDIAKVRIKFENDCVCDLSASRVSLEKHRKIRIFQLDSYISLDYAARYLKVYKKKVPHPRSFSDIQIESPKIQNYDQLECELNHFIECIKHGKQPLVSGQHGRDALEVVHEILKIIKLDYQKAS